MNSKRKDRNQSDPTWDSSANDQFQEKAIVGKQERINPFVDVHNKVKALKERTRELNKSDAERRENKVLQDVKELLDK